MWSTIIRCNHAEAARDGERPIEDLDVQASLSGTAARGHPAAGCIGDRNDDVLLAAL